jgi:hypothetical protein
MNGEDDESHYLVRVFRKLVDSPGLPALWWRPSRSPGGRPRTSGERCRRLPDRSWPAAIGWRPWVSPPTNSRGDHRALHTRYGGAEFNWPHIGAAVMCRRCNIWRVIPEEYARSAITASGHGDLIEHPPRHAGYHRTDDPACPYSTEATGKSVPTEHHSTTDTDNPPPPGEHAARLTPNMGDRP